jgi:hypothetical protein
MYPYNGPPWGCRVRSTKAEAIGERRPAYEHLPWWREERWQYRGGGLGGCWWTDVLTPWWILFFKLDGTYASWKLCIAATTSITFAAPASPLIIAFVAYNTAKSMSPNHLLGSRCILHKGRCRDKLMQPTWQLPQPPCQSATPPPLLVRVTCRCAVREFRCGGNQRWGVSRSRLYYPLTLLGNMLLSGHLFGLSPKHQTPFVRTCWW